MANRESGAAPARSAPLQAILVNDGTPDPTRRPPITQASIDGVRAAAEKLHLRTRIVWGQNDAGFRRVLDESARRSKLVLVGATPQLRDVAAIARAHPRTRFVLSEATDFKGSPFVGAHNVTGLAFDDRSAGYLSGYLAGLMTKSPATISAVGGAPTPAVRNLIRGFVAGAKRARPSVRVLIGYADSFLDQPRCEDIAIGQIDRGAQVVFDVAGPCGFGALQAAGTRGVWGIGVDDDLSYLGPHILASAVKHFDRATALAVTLANTGSLPAGKDVHLGLAADAIGLVGISDRVPADVRAKLERLADELRAADQPRG